MSSSGALRAFVLAALVVVFGVGLPQSQSEEGSAQARERPNIVFILTDDLDASSTSFMPELQALMVDQGTTFENAFVTDPLCCPSRATFLRGQYSHNTGIRSNSPPLGGHEKFRGEGRDRSTVATWLDDAGYYTAYFGKYMNGYEDTKYVPPGWDRWFGWLGNYYSPGGEYRLNENGSIEAYNRDRIHDTDLLKAKAVHFVRAQEEGDRPFFAYVATNAPHSPAYVARRHEGMFDGRALPRPPSFDESIVFDKPGVVRRPRLTPGEAQSLGDLYRRRLASLRSVDDMIGALIRALKETDQLHNTYVVFASDNGYLLGQHRLTKKSLPYEESIRIPLIVRGPDVPAQKPEHLVTNNDFAPTVAQLAGVEPPSFVDGKSFVPLLGAGEKPPLAAWRTGFLVEHAIPNYQALRTNDHTYVEWSSGEQELYDLEADPYQLRSVHDAPANQALIEKLSSQLATLRDCKADLCRAAEVR
ncbi:MAG TPA: sulfatase [Rubrobacteraceae bacterium]|nr:sulfatase [Rubrobacteraceae bacterium]